MSVRRWHKCFTLQRFIVFDQDDNLEVKFWWKCQAEKEKASVAMQRANNWWQRDATLLFGFIRFTLETSKKRHQRIKYTEQYDFSCAAQRSLWAALARLLDFTFLFMSIWNVDYRGLEFLLTWNYILNKRRSNEPVWKHQIGFILQFYQFYQISWISSWHICLLWSTSLISSDQSFFYVAVFSSG